MTYMAYCVQLCPLLILIMPERHNGQVLEQHLTDLLAEASDGDTSDSRAKLNYFKTLLQTTDGDDGNYGLFLEACGSYETAEMLLTFMNRINTPEFLPILQDNIKTRAFFEGLARLKQPARIGFILGIIKYINNGNFLALFEKFVKLAQMSNLDQLRNLDEKYLAILVRLYPGEENIDKWIGIAVEFSRLNYPVAFFTDDIKDLIEKFSGHDLNEISGVLIQLAAEVKKAGKLSLKRVFAQIVELESSDLALVQASFKFIRVGIYPTERLVKYYLQLKTEKEQMEFESLVEEKLQKIADEKVNPNDDLERELFYSHLGVNVDVEEFNEVLEKHADREVRFEHGHIRSFKIKANGVEVITENVDLPYVFDLRDKMLGLAQDETIIAELRGIEGLPRNVMTVKQKATIQDEVIAVVTDSTKRMKDIHDPSTLFSMENSIGQIDRLEKLPVSQAKLALLNQNSLALSLLIGDNNRRSRIANLSVSTKTLINQNTAKAEAERNRCRTLMAQTATELAEKIDPENSDIEAINALVEYYYEIAFSSSRNKEENELLPKIRRVLYQSSVSILERERSLMPRVLAVTSAVMYNLALQNAGLMSKVIELLTAQALRDNVELLEVLSGNDVGRVLEKAYMIFTEKLPVLMEENLMALHNINHDQGFVKGAVKLANDEVVLLVKNMMQQVRSGVRGGLFAACKRASNDKLSAEVERFLENFDKKLQDVKHDLDSPPSYIARNYNPETIAKIAKSLKFHTGNNRTLEKLSSTENLGDDDKALIGAVKDRMTAMIPSFSECESMLSKLEQLRAELGSVASLSEMRDFFSQAISFIEDKVNSLEEHKKYRILIARLEEEKTTEREAVKNKILEEYQRECADNGTTFDVAELQGRTLNEVKKIDKEYGQKMRMAKKEFEQTAQHECKMIDLYEKLKKILINGNNLCDFESALEENQTGQIKEELSKISFVDTSEGELEVEISKRLGDAYKGYVSGDCSPGHDGDRHIHVRSFFNSRIYQHDEGQRKWVGNGYLLDAEIHGVPVLVVDALQLPRCEVNHRQFIRNFIEGIASSARQSGYRYIISNKINDHYAGYLVSNSPKLREAYMKEYAEAEIMELQRDDIAIDNPEKLFFQAINQSNGQFVILWQAPEVELAHEFGEVEELLAARVEASDLQLLKTLYKEKKLFLETYLLTEVGFDYLKGLTGRGDSQILGNYIQILNSLVTRRIRLVNFDQLSAIFNTLFEIIAIDRDIFQTLVDRNVFDIKQLESAKEILLWANGDPDKRAFITNYILAGIGQYEMVWVENIYRVVGRFDSGLYPQIMVYLKTSKFETAIQKLEKLADWLDTSESPYSESSIALVLENGLLKSENYEDIFELMEVFKGITQLRRYSFFIFIVQFIKVSGAGQIRGLREFLKTFMTHADEWNLDMAFLDRTFMFGLRFNDCNLTELKGLIETYAGYCYKAGPTYSHDLSDIIVRNRSSWARLTAVLKSTNDASVDLKQLVVTCLSAGRINHAEYLERHPDFASNRSMMWIIRQLKDQSISGDMSDSDLVKQYLEFHLDKSTAESLSGLDVFVLGLDETKVFKDIQAKADLAQLVDPSFLAEIPRGADNKFTDQKTSEELDKLIRGDKAHLEEHGIEDEDDNTDKPEKTEVNEPPITNFEELFNESGSVYRDERHFYK